MGGFCLGATHGLNKGKEVGGEGLGEIFPARTMALGQVLESGGESQRWAGAGSRYDMGNNYVPGVGMAGHGAGAGCVGSSQLARAKDQCVGETTNVRSWQRMRCPLPRQE